ncbi:superoxide dismutase [Candidatus Gottesmanbacteria bacterium RIFCSPLOWO2_01_FULL_39_12b]|uniref:Superoxide dismutase n=1 Tax=Candidatus Gottesmanbacteria bacterium RIFCSPLOWO2_01_FULL_39_12b TaxID=1798388 RepID=A0A1F6AQ76_9BACT|nr:MAG: superoxide dismutase [Candidatus Gottesmanbacteria bacterium RIFCSPLOWO2_01_FULL_39_12b]
MKYQLPLLEYPYNALEPYIDAQTMEIHHTKHHQAYIDNLNKVLEKYPKIEGQKLEDLLKSLNTLTMDERDKKMLRNHGAGHLNHTLFWQIMGAKKELDEKLVAEVIKEFGTIDEFKKLFNQTALSHFGSGWAWLVRNKEGKLAIYSLPNQDSPYINGHTPLIGLDVWEHAYYLKYQNRRADYIANWWNVLKLI